MKRLIILLFSIVMAGEMTVDGNLTVTDTLHVTTIQSATIDSLEQLISLQQQQISTLQGLIAQLQAQIALLETQMAFLGQDLNNADCFGVVGGSAVVDECSICDGDGTMQACG